MVERHTVSQAPARVGCGPADSPGRDPTAPVPLGAGDILSRAVAWSTVGLAAAAAARVVAEATTSPAWAARHAYALGYWEGGEDAQARVAEELAALERQLLELRAALARPWWRLLLDWSLLRRLLGRGTVTT